MIWRRLDHVFFWLNLGGSMVLNVFYENRKIEAVILLAAASIIGAMQALHKRRDDINDASPR